MYFLNDDLGSLNDFDVTDLSVDEWPLTSLGQCRADELLEADEQEDDEEGDTDVKPAGTRPLWRRVCSSLVKTFIEFSVCLGDWTTDVDGGGVCCGGGN